MDNTENRIKGGKIVLLIFLLVCSGLGIAAFAMAMTKCKKDGFEINDTVNNCVCDRGYCCHPNNWCMNAQRCATAKDCTLDHGECVTKKKQV